MKLFLRKVNLYMTNVKRTFKQANNCSWILWFEVPKNIQIICTFYNLPQQTMVSQHHHTLDSSFGHLQKMKTEGKLLTLNSSSCFSTSMFLFKLCSFCRIPTCLLAVSRSYLMVFIIACYFSSSYPFECLCIAWSS